MALRPLHAHQMQQHRRQRRWGNDIDQNLAGDDRADAAEIGRMVERALPLPAFGPSWPFVADGVLDLLALLGPRPT